MIEALKYQPVEELQTLSLEELRALWELVPTERQRAYRTAYDREVRNAGAIGSDDLERRVAAALLHRYVDSALVPVGSRWARTPTRVQQAARDNEMTDQQADALATGSDKPSVRVVAFMGVTAAMFVVFVLLRLAGGSTTDGASGRTPEPSDTPTPEVSPTPTPLALEAQDSVIRGGDTERTAAYPVNLQVVSPDGSAPRVWVVQRREIRAAEWNFDPNPDIASFVNGMSVRPVIGIPWSEDNAALFDSIDDGTVFNLSMNTGAILRYEFAAKTAVLRSDTRIFRQVGPGLVLLLIGEMDTDGLPTGTRTLVTANYPPQQELSRGGELLGLSTIIQEGEIGSALELGNAATLTLRDVSVVGGAEADQQELVFDLDIRAEVDDVNTTLWRFELIDGGGQVYLPNIETRNHVGDNAMPSEIPALARIPASIGFFVPADLLDGRLVIVDRRGQSVSFRFVLDPNEPLVQPSGVDVRLVSVTTLEGQITTRLRIFNGQTIPVTFTQDDIWMALGYAPDPPGPRNPAEGMPPFELLPEQAVNLTLVWYWVDEPYASMGVGDYRFAIQLVRNS